MTLSYEALCSAVCRLLKPDGRFALVLPVNAAMEFLKVAEKNGLFLHKQLIIIPIEGRKPNRFNLELKKVPCEASLSQTFTIRSADNRFTEEYNQYLKDFYLGL